MVRKTAECGERAHVLARKNEVLSAVQEFRKSYRMAGFQFDLLGDIFPMKCPCMWTMAVYILGSVLDSNGLHDPADGHYTKGMTFWSDVQDPS